MNITICFHVMNDHPVKLVKGINNERNSWELVTWEQLARQRRAWLPRSRCTNASKRSPAPGYSRVHQRDAHDNSERETLLI